MRCFLVSDLHGHPGRYDALGDAIAREDPDAVFLGGDLLSSRFLGGHAGAEDLLRRHAARVVRRAGGAARPRLFVILGNDDPAGVEPMLRDGEAEGLWTYVHGRAVPWAGWKVYGYQFVSPTPFLLKDWERYDVSRHVDPGCVSPEEGWRTVAADPHVIRHATIARDLEALFTETDLGRAILLFHAPPYATGLDRAALDGRTIDGVPCDVHVGSVAIRRFIESRQPHLTLHGHIHESARLTGSWLDTIGRTVMISAAHDGPELALVRFDPAAPAEATRELL